MSTEIPGAATDAAWSWWRRLLSCPPLCSINTRQTSLPTATRFSARLGMHGEGPSRSFHRWCSWRNGHGALRSSGRSHVWRYDRSFCCCCDQVIVDALIQLMPDYPNDELMWMDFLCYCTASGRAVVDPAVTLTLLEHLSTSLKGVRNRSKMLISCCPCPFRKRVDWIHGERRRAAVLRNCTECGNWAWHVKAVTWKMWLFLLICVVYYRTSLKLTYLEGKKALGLAQNANMLIAAALLHHLFGEYKSALEQYIKAGNVPSGNSCFAYFEASVAHFVEYRKLQDLELLRGDTLYFESSCFQCRLNKGAVLSCMGDLANLNPESAASMVMRHFPNDQEAVIQGLHGQRELLFKYLKSSMETALTQVLSSRVLSRMTAASV